MKSEYSEKELSRGLVGYTCKSSGIYDVAFNKEIRELRPDWFVNSATAKKEELLELAKNGEPKPHHSSMLGSTLGSYICKVCSSYDAVFDKEIRELAPDWFVNPADANKEELLKLARSGEPRPYHKTRLGKFLHSYINKGKKYNSKFNTQIRESAPHWFVNPATAKKEELLELAKNGEPKPYCKSKLGHALKSYTSKCNTSYDLDFDKQIRELAPGWIYVNPSIANKKELLKLAKDGRSRPNCQKCKLGRRLTDYTNKLCSSYNAAFDKEIRELRPDWFVNPADEKREELLKIAKSGGPKPQPRTKIWTALSNYTNKSGSYNLAFDKEIRELRPDWFINTADEKKKEFLKLAKTGKPKPNGRSRLGQSLSSYTNKNNDAHDPIFDKEIRELRPQWFRKAS